MSSKYIIADQKFHPIGQGLFYSLDLNFDLEYEFIFVYDCGSLSVKKYIEDEIKDFRRLYDVIDILVISHFDEDHVNGVADLITGKKVKKLILPYVDWKERLAIAIELTEGENKEYIQMLVDPISFFNSERFDVDEIIIVGGPGDGTLANQEPPSPITPKGIQFNREFSPLDTTVIGHEQEPISTENLLMDFITSDSPIPFDKIKFYADGLKVAAGIFWEFEMYNQDSADLTKIKALDKALNTYMTKNMLSKLDLFDLGHREQMRKIYRSVYKNLNQTSIVLYHGAVLEHQVVRYGDIYSLESSGWERREILSNEKTGTMLTGDLKVSSKKAINKLTSYFRNFLPLTSIFSLPHHGATANWNFYHANGLEDFELYVASSRIGSKHHPSKDVIKDILLNCKGDPFLVNEAREYRSKTILKINMPNIV